MSNLAIEIKIAACYTGRTSRKTDVRNFVVFLNSWDELTFLLDRIDNLIHPLDKIIKESKKKKKK